METKKCTKCNEVKNVSEFYKDKAKKDCLAYYCKTCVKHSYYKPKEIKNKFPYIFDKKINTAIRRKINKINYLGVDALLKDIKLNKAINHFSKNKVLYNPYINELNIIEKCVLIGRFSLELDEEFYIPLDINKTIVFIEFLIRRYNKLKQYKEQSCKIKFNRKIKDKIYRKENKEYYKKYHKEYVSNKSKTNPIYKFTARVRSIISQSFKRGVNQFKKTAKTEQILGCNIEEFRKYIESQFKEGMTFENHGKKGWHLDHIIPISKATTEEEVIKLNHYTNFQPLWWHENISKGNRKKKEGN